MAFLLFDKLRHGDKIAIISPSFAAPAQWPHVYELALSRLRDVFGLEPVEFAATKRLGPSAAEQSEDLVTAFKNPEIKAVIASLGGDDHVTYIKYLPTELSRKTPICFSALATTPTSPTFSG